jgi:hypothetical protein
MFISASILYFKRGIGVLTWILAHLGPAIYGLQICSICIQYARVGGWGVGRYIYRTILPENRSTVNKFMADICVAVYALAIDPVSKKHYLLGGFSFLAS